MSAKPLGLPPQDFCTRLSGILRRNATLKIALSLDGRSAAMNVVVRDGSLTHRWLVGPQGVRRGHTEEVFGMICQVISLVRLNFERAQLIICEQAIESRSRGWIVITIEHNHIKHVEHTKDLQL